MPVEVKIAASRTFKPSNDEERAAFAVAKAQGVKTMDIGTATDNVRLSGGMYEILPDVAPNAVEVKVPELEDLSLDQLKVMMLQTGVTPQKIMSKGQVITLIRNKLAQVEITE
jgi:hypothetical protein